MTSIQPRKQRRERANAPLSVRRKFMSVHISKKLRQKLGTKMRSITVRKGDKVRVCVGDHYNKEGSVMEVDYSDLKVYVEGVVSKNSRGVEKLRALEPSNLEIIDGDFASKDRKAILERAKKAAPAAGAQKQ